MGQHKGKHVRKDGSRKVWLSALVVGFLGLGISGILFTNSQTFAAWVDETAGGIFDLKTGNLELVPNATSDKVDVGVWIDGTHKVSATDVELSTVKMMPRSTLTYSTSFDVLLEGLNKAEVSCEIEDSGTFAPISQDTEISDSNGNPVPVASLTLKNGDAVVDHSILATAGDKIDAFVTITQPATGKYPSKSGVSLELPKVSCNIAQVSK